MEYVQNRVWKVWRQLQEEHLLEDRREYKRLCSILETSVY